MKQSSTCWKVVRNKNGRLVSTSVDGIAQVTYIPGEWVKAHRKMNAAGMKLLVFRNVLNCYDFVYTSWLNGQNEVWECECVGASNPSTMFASIYLMYTAKTFDRIINSALARSRLQYGISEWPDGTLMAEAVNLTRRVDFGEYVDDWRKAGGKY